MVHLLQKHYTEEVTAEEQLQKAKSYPPYHPVFHPHKPSKVQLVFDCSAKYRRSSLNDQLLQGPDLANMLVGVLTLFQEEPVAFMHTQKRCSLKFEFSPVIATVISLVAREWSREGAKGVSDVGPFVQWSLIPKLRQLCCNAVKKTAGNKAKEYDAIPVEGVKRNSTLIWLSPISSYRCSSCSLGQSTSPVAVKRRLSANQVDI